jgi:hypothetical protein
VASYFQRPALAKKMARQLLKPDVLDEGLRSGLFISGQRRTGKTTFLLNDLIPALEEAGAIVVYVDLWQDPQANPAELVRRAIRSTLADLQAPTSTIREKLKRVNGVDLGVFGFSFGMSIDDIGTDAGPTLASALTELVDQSGRDVVMIIDEVQHAVTTDGGHEMLLALKAARDAINPRPGTAGHFLFVGTGSHRAHVRELSTRRNQAFTGATSINFPMLDDDYVSHLLNRLDKEGKTQLPSHTVAAAAFRTLGHRPEEMLRAIRELSFQLPPGANPDDYLPTIAATLRASAADVELAKVAALGPLAVVAFEYIAETPNGETKGLYSAEALAFFSRKLGREVRSEETQQVLNDLIESNIVMRPSHGLYGITDPFVHETWQRSRQLEIPE